MFFAGSVGVSTFWGVHTKSTAALMYLLIYGLWILCCPVNGNEYNNYMRRIAFYSCVICIIGVAQYFAQFAFKFDHLFSWRGAIPGEYLIEYNTLNELTYDSGIFKSNGFFLLEASLLSGLAARELLIVVTIVKDTRYIIPLVLGMGFALSGQGIVFTLIFVTVPLAALSLNKMRSDRSSQLQASLGIVAVLALLSILVVFSDYFLDRVGEFSDPRSSAYARYTSSLNVFNEDVMRSFGTFFFGYGPGGFEPLTRNSSLAEHCTGWIKLFVELGFLGILSFSAFFLVCVHSATRSWYISIAMLFHYIVLDSTVLSPQLTFLAFAMFILPVRMDVEKPDERRLAPAMPPRFV